jgi:hypothetical protein
MGAFDSFYVNNIEIQTKQLTCTQNSYMLGDTVLSDDNETDFYIIEEDPEIGWIGLIVLNQIFVNYSIGTTEETCRGFTELSFNHHKQNGNDTSRMFANVIKENINPRLYDAEQRLHWINRAIAAHEVYVANPDGDSIFSFLDFWENFKNGDSLESVIKMIMGFG